MVVTQLWFSGYDLSSKDSDTLILDSLSVITMIILFNSLGIYARRIAYQLFSDPKLLDMMRLQSKVGSAGRINFVSNFDVKCCGV